ncbi:MAG: PilZ domain-containing protein [Spirochaetales bacterium]|nr:PilZ domain-containing protein [Spirochaetales bacterium]
MENEKRKNQRHEWKEVLKYENREQGGDATAVNITPDGICIRTEKLLEPDSLLTLNMTLGDGRVIPVKAKVIYNKMHSHSKGYFSGLSILPQSREQMAEYIESMDPERQLTVYLSREELAFLNGLSEDEDEKRAIITGLSRFFKGLDLKVNKKIESEQDLVSFLKDELKKRL